MTVGQLLEEVSKAGLTLRLTDTGGINARPVDRITPALRDLLKAHKTDLVAALRQAEQDGLAIAKSPDTHATKPTELAKRSATPGDLWPRLEAIAHKCCDHWQDSAERRAGMLAELRAMTPDWQRHWLEHLEASYGKPK